MSYSINDPYKYNDTISITLSDTTMGTGIPVQTVSNTSPGQSSIYDFGNYNTNVYTIGSASDTITLSDWTTNAGWSNSLDVKGDANFEGDVKIKGKSLVDSLEKIEEKTKKDLKSFTAGSFLHGDENRPCFGPRGLCLQGRDQDFARSPGSSSP